MALSARWMWLDVDVNGGKFAVTASDGSLAISSNKFTVAGNTGNTVVAGTLNATGAATLSSTLDVAGGVDVNSGKFAVTALDGSLAISSNKFTVAGDTGNTVVAGTGLDATGLLCCDAVEHAGCGRRRGREQWEVCVTLSGRSTLGFGVGQVHGGWQHGQHGGGGDWTDYVERLTGAATLSSTLDVARCDVDVNSCREVCGDGIGRVAGDFVEQVHGGWQHGQHGGGGDAGRDVERLSSSGAATLSSTLDVAGDVDVNSGKFAVTALDGSLAISSNKFTVAGNTGNMVAGDVDVGEDDLC